MSMTVYIHNCMESTYYPLTLPVHFFLFRLLCDLVTMVLFLLAL